MANSHADFELEVAHKGVVCLKTKGMRGLRNHRNSKMKMCSFTVGAVSREPRTRAVRVLGFKCLFCCLLAEQPYTSKVSASICKTG